MGNVQQRTRFSGFGHSNTVKDSSIAGSLVLALVAGIRLVVSELQVTLGHVNVRNDDVMFALSAQGAALACD